MSTSQSSLFSPEVPVYAPVLLAAPDPILISEPTTAHAAAMWRIARDSRSLDLNSSYAYLLWCADFSATSAVATCGEDVVGFVTGYVPPDDPGTIMIWQVAVRDEFRGRGVARALLNAVIDRGGFTWLKCTVGRSNDASAALFTGLADERHAILSRTTKFATSDFPDAHEPEDLFVIGPLQTEEPRAEEEPELS